MLCLRWLNWVVERGNLKDWWTLWKWLLEWKDKVSVFIRLSLFVSYLYKVAMSERSIQVWIKNSYLNLLISKTLWSPSKLGKIYFFQTFSYQLVYNFCILLILVAVLGCLTQSEMYSGPCQTYMMEPFVKQSSVIDIWHRQK